MVKSTSQIKQIANNLVIHLEKKGIKVDRLLLYGSYANGNPLSYSDIDIAVISSSFDNKSLIKRQELLAEAIFPLDEPIEAIGYGYQEFKKSTPLSFLSEIIAKGKIIYKG